MFQFKKKSRFSQTTTQLCHVNKMVSKKYKIKETKIIYNTYGIKIKINQCHSTCRKTFSIKSTAHGRDEAACSFNEIWTPTTCHISKAGHTRSCVQVSLSNYISC